MQKQLVAVKETKKNPISFLLEKVIDKRSVTGKSKLMLR